MRRAKNVASLRERRKPYKHLVGKREKTRAFMGGKY
jgi:hypothetical protein